MSRSLIPRILKLAGVTIGSLILLLAVAITIFVWQRQWMPFLDDGPFKGRPVVTLPTTEPIQIFPVREFVLEVYSSATKNESPVVLLRDRDKKIKWAVYAEGLENTRVTALNFIDYRTVFDITVRGTVHWTFGHEVMWWMIDRDGSLKEYWYSW